MGELPMGVTVFEGDTTNFKKIRVKKEVAEYGWVKSLPAPLERDEEVFVVPDQEGVDPRFVKVVHSEWKSVSTFHKNHFVWENSLDI
jgi:hypothetical protein